MGDNTGFDVHLQFDWIPKVDQIDPKGFWNTKIKSRFHFVLQK